MAKVGEFRGQRGARYWVGGCTCGSGREGCELYDRMGIYCGITCVLCKKEDTFAPGIINDDAAYEVDEPIEEDKR